MPTAISAEFTSVGIAGAGLMGLGIAALACQHGHSVLVYDPEESAVESASAKVGAILQQAESRGHIPSAADALARLRTTTRMTDLRCDLVIETAPESLSIKRELFHQLEAIVSPKAVLATNTSTLPVSRVAAVLHRPERCVGMHFFNPVAAMKLVEVIAGRRTDPEITAAIVGLARKWGKTPIAVADSPGFVVNRVARPFYLESLRIVEGGGTEPATVDALLEAHGFKLGPFKLMDLIGVDTNHAVSQSLYDAFYQAPRFRPSRLQQQLVDARQLGKKTGRGFYQYPEPV